MKKIKVLYFLELQKFEKIRDIGEDIGRRGDQIENERRL